MGSGKPRGIRSARKLLSKRKANRLADTKYRHRMLSSNLQNPFAGSCMAKGIVTEKMGVESKQPNSAVRKCVRVFLKKTGKKVAAFVPGDGGLNYVHENDEVLLAGLGKKGKSKGDIPGIRFQVIAVKNVSLKTLIHRR